MRLLRNKFVTVWLFGLAALATVLAVPLLPTRPLAPLETIVFDTYQRIKPRAWAGNAILVLDIDEASIRRVGQWPWPRSTVASMVDRLTELGAAAIVFDIVFAEPDRTSPLRAVERLSRAGARIELPAKTDMLDNDAVLADAFARSRVVTGMRLSPNAQEPPPLPKAGVAFSGTAPEHLMARDMGAVRNLPVLDRNAAGIGDFGFDPEAQTDAVVRKARLMRGANGAWYPSLALETLRVVQGAGAFILKATDGSGEADTGRPALVAARVGQLEVPTDADGAITVWHSPASAKAVLPARALLHPAEAGLDESALAARVANHIVLVGTSAEGLLDLRATPLAPVVPGVTIHADIIDQVIAGELLQRPDWARGAEWLAALLFGLILLACLPVLPPLGDGLAALLLAAIALAGAWYAFDTQGLLLSPVMPLLGIAAAYGGGTAADLLVTERQGRFVREAFGLYLAPALVERLARQPEGLKLGGEEKELTVLFCDIRGFTGLSEGLDPTELTELLNDFLTPMTTALLEKGATIDKYMGDAIMAFWNAPLDLPDHRQRACEAVLAMRAELKALNARARRPIAIGIGLNTGPCCVGNLGSEQRFNYSAIGDAVNVASRVEGQTKAYGLDNLATRETIEGIGGMALLEVDRLGVVGRQEPLQVHTVLGDAALARTAEFAALREAHETMLDAWRAGDMEEAAVAMALASRRAEPLHARGAPSLLTLYALYGERIAGLRETGVPPDWDGVIRAQTK